VDHTSKGKNVTNSITAKENKERAPIDFTEYAAKVRALQAAYEAKTNARVPVTFIIDEQFWMRHSGYTFKDFYTNPVAHMNAQLEGNAWFANNIICDLVPGEPDTWEVSAIHWMEENEYFGCEVVYQENDYAWALPSTLSKQDLLKHIADLDPDDRVRKNSAYRLYLGLKELAEGKTYMDRPIHVSFPGGGGTQGIFTKAGEIRGLEQLCMDLYDDPDWAAAYLNLITDKTIARSKAWYRLIHGKEQVLPAKGGYQACDDSLQMISADLYERFVLPCHEKYFSAFTTGWRGIHLCGRSMQHYKVLHDRLGISLIDGPGLFVDHGKYLRELGPDFAFNAQFDHTILALGSEQDIDTMLRRLLRPENKLPGRFQIRGYVHRLTRLENLALCYRLALQYGTIDTSIPSV
jgi:hypothetical protein